MRQKLWEQFQSLLSDAKGYAARVRRECRGFPEGDLFPYVLPACAYTNVAVGEPKLSPQARKRVAQLVELARPAVVRRVRPPGAKLENLKVYRNHATYLGQYNLALGCYRLIGGDDRFADEHKAVSDALHEALVKARGRPLWSLPGLCWPFDTIPCLLSLRLYDRCTGVDRTSVLIKRHLEWVKRHATDSTTGLPYSRIDLRSGRALERPRGCELSWRICLMAQIDEAAARPLYRSYVKSFWLDRGVIAGFAEWPGGRSGRQDRDSGPILLGVGMSASGFGLGAATAMADAPRAERLCAQLAEFRTLLEGMIRRSPASRRRLTMGGVIDPRSTYSTGFLFGDACLFYAITWRRWPPGPPRGACRPAAAKEGEHRGP
jgi:hypothetical protein